MRDIALNFSRPVRTGDLSYYNFLRLGNGRLFEKIHMAGYETANIFATLKSASSDPLR